jgi:hypothetical protein
MYIIPRDETEQTVWLLELCRMNTQKNEASVRQFSEKDLPIKHGRQQMTVYGELDATKLREQKVIAERDALVLREQQALEEIEKLKALLAEKKS